MTSEGSTAERAAQRAGRPSGDPAARAGATPSGFTLAPGYGIGGVLDALDPSYREPAGDGDEYWMRQALLSAMAAQGRASPNPTVGAAIVKDGVLIATGATEAYGGRHAERCAIDSVSDRSVLHGATLYSTLEPCAHWGKQPPCADLVASCGFARCVVAILDPNPHVAGAGAERVRTAGTQVLSGVLRNEVLAWHLPYLFPYLVAQDGPGSLVSAFAVRAGDGGRYRDWLKQKCDLVVTEPSLASIDPAAFDRGPWRGLLWWDLGDRLARMSLPQARELATRALQLAVPVALVCAVDPDNAAQVDACMNAGIRYLAAPAGVDPATRLLALLRGELATDSRPPAWALVDGHPDLAEALAGAQVLDAIHAVPADDTPDSGSLTGRAAALSRISARGTVGGISEYVSPRLRAALD
jgi:diaminohydroxyphosphoribosylaminopyrimidine deaminase/5-amino-6-(5-phosphoribosylamino)uracil reductase